MKTLKTYLKTMIAAAMFTAVFMTTPVNAAAEGTVPNGYEDDKESFILEGSNDGNYPSAVTSDWKKQKSLIYEMFPFAAGARLTAYSSTATVKETGTDENGSEVITVYEWNDAVYRYPDSTEDNAFGYGYEYSAVIDKESGRISRVFDTEINYEDPDSNFDDEVFAEDLYADAAEAELQMAGNYSPDKAVAYADKYWENYNPAYHNYNPDGGDCANFTSQCLYAGGLQMDSKWKASGTPLRGSVAWINATGLKNYLSENVGKSFDNQLNFGGSLAEVQKRVAKGDAVFYWNAKRNRYGHAAICVGTDSKGVPIVNAHNNNRYHVMWTLGYERCAVVNITAHGTSDGPSSNPAEPEPAKPAEPEVPKEPSTPSSNITSYESGITRFDPGTKINEAKVFDIPDQYYTGRPITPAIEASLNGIPLIKGQDYTVSWKNNKNAGTATVTLKGVGELSGTVRKTFTIKRRKLSDAVIVADTALYKKGKKAKPAVYVFLDGLKVGASDYKIDYGTDFSTGAHTIILTAKNKSKKFEPGSEASVNFIIADASCNSVLLRKAKVKGLEKKEYDGNAQVQNSFNVRVGKEYLTGNDYSVQYFNNTDAGTAFMLLTGTGKYTGVKLVKFKIKKSKAYADVKVDDASCNFTGYAQRPPVKVTLGSKTLVEGVDYTLSYSKNIKAGTGKVKVKGKGNYTGNIGTADFSINEIDWNKVTAYLPTYTYAYKGHDVKPVVQFSYAGKKLNLKSGKAYKVRYGNHHEVSSKTPQKMAVIEIKPAGSFAPGDKKILTFTIK